MGSAAKLNQLVFCSSATKPSFKCPHQKPGDTLQLQAFSTITLPLTCAPLHKHSSSLTSETPRKLSVFEMNGKGRGDTEEQDIISKQMATGPFANPYPALAADNFRRPESVYTFISPCRQRQVWAFWKAAHHTLTEKLRSWSHRFHFPKSTVGNWSETEQN